MGSSESPSFAWEPWLTRHALPLWWEAGYDHGAGGFYEGLTDPSRPVVADMRSRTQTRQIYVYSTGHIRGWGDFCRSAVEQGVAFYVKHYRRPDGLFRTLVARGGASVDEAATTYDQAFSLLALASATSVGACPDGPRLARDLLRAMDADRRDDRGLYREVEPHPYQANCHMHLLEASLEWEALDPSGPWVELSDRIAETCLELFADPATGALVEFFTREWRPPSNRSELVVEPGHNFEWSWLIERWSQRRARPDGHDVATRFYAFGCKGITPDGVTIDEIDIEGRVVKPTARLWPQTERVKACAILAETAQADGAVDYRGDLGSALDTLHRYVAPAPEGLWMERIQADGRFTDEYTRATSLYHIVCAISDLTTRTVRPAALPA